MFEITPEPEPEPEIEIISALESVELGGLEQWILLQGGDTSNPVLLVLHGGPGYVMMPLFHEINSELEHYFTVVNWDQRGAGKSYAPQISESSMTLEQFVSDAHELTQYLKGRFNQDKIYIVGHSFGTVLGIHLIDAYPEDYWGYVGVGQVVDIIENEQRMYDFVWQKAQDGDHEAAIAELVKIGRPSDDGEYLDDEGYEITMKWVAYYGGDLFGKQDTQEIEDIIWNHEIYADDQTRILNGLAFSELLFEDEAVWYLDFRTQVTQFQVPVYFFAGHYDYDTPSELVQQYFDRITAPSKNITWFENSAHFPFYEQPEKFNASLINILDETYFADSENP